jgi:glycine/D-amino acid oxidase-like deaminating enzyme
MTDFPNSADVVVIGAGVQGLSAAYHLAKMGITDVVVVEQEFVGAGSSGRSASMLMLQVWTEWQVRFSQYCFGRFMTFEEEFGASPGYRPYGSLTLVPETVAAPERTMYDIRQQLGVRSEWWSPDDVKRRYPFIHTDDLAFAVFGPEDGEIDAQAIMMGYQQSARRLGVDICQGVKATGLTIDRQRVTAVQTTAGEIATRFVVNAAGADAARVGQWASLDIPIDNRVRNIYITDAFPLIGDHSPFVWDAAEEWYYRSEKPGVLIGKGKRKLDSAPMAIDWPYLEEIMDVIMHRVPALAEVGIARGWSGIRPLSPDQRPIIGPVAELEGYVNDCGWGGEGIMHSPVGGQLVAEWIHDAKTSTFEIEPFLLARFQKPQGQPK